MARRKAPAHEVHRIERDGVAIDIDRTWVRSWDGLDAAAAMQDESMTVSERFLATVDYYRHACPNVRDVEAALRARSDGAEVTGADVMAFIGAAIREDTPKN